MGFGCRGLGSSAPGVVVSLITPPPTPAPQNLITTQKKNQTNNREELRLQKEVVGCSFAPRLSTEDFNKYASPPSPSPSLSLFCPHAARRQSTINPNRTELRGREGKGRGKRGDEAEANPYTLTYIHTQQGARAAGADPRGALRVRPPLQRRTREEGLLPPLVRRRRFVRRFGPASPAIPTTTTTFRFHACAPVCV